MPSASNTVQFVPLFPYDTKMPDGSPGYSLIVFITAIGINVGRGNAIDCGCFNVADAGKTYQQRMFDMKLDVWRDLGMLLMVAQVWMADKKARTG